MKTDKITGYEVTLISVDNQKYIYKVNAPIEQQAIASAHERIIELGWEHHQYKLDKIIPILKGTIQYAKTRN